MPVMVAGRAREILTAYQFIQKASPATALGEIRSPDSLVSFFAIRRAAQDRILGKDQALEMLKSADPLRRASAASVAADILGNGWAAAVMPLLSDTSDAAAPALEAAVESLITDAASVKSAAALLEVLNRLPLHLRRRAMDHFGKIRYRPAVSKLEELFDRRDPADAPAACRALAAIQGKSFLDSITEHLGADSPIELNTAILECMADNPAPVHFGKASQLLQSSRNRPLSLEIIRRIALWGNEGLDLSVTLLGSLDTPVAESAQAGLTRKLRSTSTLPPGLLSCLSKSAFDRASSDYAAPARDVLPPQLENLDRKLSEILSARRDAEFQQLFFMGLTTDKHFLKSKLVQLAKTMWGDDASAAVEESFTLPPAEAGLLRMRLQRRSERDTEQQASAFRIARILESIGDARLKAPLREVIRHLDTTSLPVQLAAVGALADIGGASEVQELEKRLSNAHWMLKRKIASALSRLSRDRLSAGLAKLCGDSEPLVRVSAVRALEWCRDESAYSILLHSLRDPDERVRSAACACLKIFPGRKDTLDRLQGALADSDARVRANTVESMEALLAQSPQELATRVKPMLTDPNARVVINAAKALFPADPESSLPVLQSYLDAPDANLRAGALWALGQLRRPDAFLCLHFHALREKDSYVRTFADRGVDLMRDHPFYRDARILLTDPRLSKPS